MKALLQEHLHIPYFIVGFIRTSETAKVQKSEGASSNGKKFDGTSSASKFPPDPRVSTGHEHVHKFRSKDSGQKQARQSVDYSWVHTILAYQPCFQLCCFGHVLCDQFLSEGAFLSKLLARNLPVSITMHSGWPQYQTSPFNYL